VAGGGGARVCVRQGLAACLCPCAQRPWPHHAPHKHGSGQGPPSPHPAALVRLLRPQPLTRCLANLLSFDALPNNPPLAGAWFREFVMDEVVKSVDALSRDQAAALAVRLGLGGARLPVLLPGERPARASWCGGSCAGRLRRLRTHPGAGDGASAAWRVAAPHSALSLPRPHAWPTSPARCGARRHARDVHRAGARDQRRGQGAGGQRGQAGGLFVKRGGWCWALLLGPVRALGACCLHLLHTTSSAAPVSVWGNEKCVRGGGVAAVPVQPLMWGWCNCQAALLTPSALGLPCV
jgi:hypothetical protein